MKDVLPFFTPHPADIRVSSWCQLVDGEWETLDAYVEDWDYRTRLRLRCTLGLDLGAVRAATRLIDGSPIAWSVGWRATDTGLVGDPTIAEVTGDGTTPISLEIPARRAGATVVLTRRLVLRRNRMAAAPGEARWAGSILWSDEMTVRLTGKGSAFPTEVVNFREYGLDPEASWYLELPSNADLPAMGSLILLINAADSALVTAVGRARRHSDLELTLIRNMEEGIVEELVRWALSRWVDLGDVEPDSVGAVARTLAHRVLPDPEAMAKDTGSMELRSAIVGGARRIGFGRVLG